MRLHSADVELVVCIKNDEYPASLEIRKIYRAIRDEAAVKLGLIRVIDESGESYIYPKDYFIPIELPESAIDIIFAVA